LADSHYGSFFLEEKLYIILLLNQAYYSFSYLYDEYGAAPATFWMRFKDITFKELVKKPIG
jgi:hypothetical protein